MSLKPLAQPNNSSDEAAPAQPLAELEGVVERITFQNEENGYTIAKLQPTKAKADQLVTIVGTLPGVVPGESLHVSGYWRSHNQYGRQLEVRNYRTMLPATIHGIQKYLGSGLIKGIGPKTSEKIVGIFGPEHVGYFGKSAASFVGSAKAGPEKG